MNVFNICFGRYLVLRVDLSRVAQKPPDHGDLSEVTCGVEGGVACLQKMPTYFKQVFFSNECYDINMKSILKYWS